MFWGCRGGHRLFSDPCHHHPAHEYLYRGNGFPCVFLPNDAADTPMGQKKGSGFCYTFSLTPPACLCQNTDTFTISTRKSSVAPEWQKAIDENPNLMRRTREEAFAGVLFHLGLKYLKGQDDSQEYKKAAEFFHQAGERGDPRAQHYLATLYFHGHGVSRYLLEALKWYRLAADKGHADVQLNLGAMYFKGLGVPKDPQESLK
ncbi:MAG: sel1 repeat family protein [Deltaproteobacteria bacterium]|nr:sel1 repeat family protein [Deltaproteobacteria bacterium]